MAAAPPTSRHLEINGLKFHYLDWGGDGPPLVMLHGLTGHAHTWDHTAAALSARYHVCALDQRGHGDTDWASRLAAETAERMVAGNPHVSLAVIPDCGHSITLDRPEGLLDAADPWLAATEPG